MEIKLPPELEAYMNQEISHKPGMDRRAFVLDAIQQHCARCEGNRKRAEIQRKKREARILQGGMD